MVTRIRLALIGFAAFLFGAQATAATVDAGFTYTDDFFNSNTYYVFRGGTSGSETSWGERDNWYITEDGGSTWEVETNVGTNTNPPGYPSSDKWNPTILDGNVMADTITKTENYKVITAPAVLEGWASKIAVRNGVHLNLEKGLKKLQSGGTWQVDATSKITTQITGGGNSNGDVHLYVDAIEGITFTNTNRGAGSDIPFKYYLGAQGSVMFSESTNKDRTHELKALALDLVAETKQVVSRQLVGTPSSETFTTTSVTVTSTIGITPVLKADGTVTANDAVGTYAFETKDDGLYVNFVAGNTIHTAPVSGAAQWTTLEWDTLWADNGVALLSVDEAADASFAFDESVTAERITFTGGAAGKTLTVSKGADVTVSPEPDYSALAGSLKLTYPLAEFPAIAGAIGTDTTPTTMTTLSGANTFTAATVTSGVLDLASCLASATEVTFSGGHASASADATTPNLTFSAATTLDIPKSVTITTPALGGNGVLTKKGKGTWKLTAAATRGTNNASAPKETIVEAGILDVTANGAQLYGTDFCRSTVEVKSGAELCLASFAYGGGFGSLADYGSYRQVAGGKLTVTGDTHTSGNGFYLTADGATFAYEPTGGSGTLTLKGNGNDNIKLAGATRIGGDGNIDMTGASIGQKTMVYGDGSLEKFGAGTLTMATANTYSGGTTVSAGVLKATAVKALGTGKVTVASGATLELTALPLKVASLTVETGGTLIVPTNDTGVWEVVAESKPLTIAGAIKVASEEGARKLEGVVSNGSFIVPQTPAKPEDDTTAYTATAQETLGVAATKEGLRDDFTVQVSTRGGTETTTLSAEKVSAVLDCFQGLTTEGNTETNTLVVSYDFGIDKLIYLPSQNGIALSAKVQSGTGAAYNTNTKVEVWKNGAKMTTQPSLINAPEGQESGEGIKWFLVPYDPATAEGALNLEIKAYNAPPEPPSAP